MIPYLTLLFLVVFIACLGRQTWNRNLKISSLYLIGFILIFFAGVRDLSVGTDTYTYVSFLNIIQSLQDISTFQLEPGFSLLVLVANKLSDGHILYLSLIALIVVFLHIKTIYHLVQKYEISLFIFIAFGTYTFFFNGARQAIAAAIVFAAIPSLLDKKFWKYLIFIFIAFFFHKSAILAMPLYFLAKPYIGLRQWAFVFIGIAILTVFLSSFAQFAVFALGDRYEGYDVNDSGGGGLVTGIFLLCQAIALYILRPRNSDYTEVYNKLLNIFLIGLVFVGVSVLSNVNPSGILRLHIYFTSMSIILWPILFVSLKDKRLREIVGFSLFFVSILYFYLTTNSFSKLVPYTINPILEII
tara:strand:+ start:23107 stop:24177 length:1071 start_codon:yes stop_codon:yes gene_type:complete